MGRPGLAHHDDPTAKRDPGMADKVFNVGVVGYGLSAKVFHIPFVVATPQLRLHSIVQRQPAPGNSAPHDHPEAKHHGDAAALFADNDVDVVVTTPPVSHFALSKAALEAGKHVLTEKPFVPTPAEADALIALARRQQHLLCVFQNRRWDGDFLMLRHLARGALGRVFEFHTHFDRYRPAAPVPASWKAELGLADGGSALYDLGAHLVDQVLVLFGMPDAVHGRLGSQRTAAVVDLVNPDNVSAQLVYGSGMIAHVAVSVLSAETAQPRFWVRGLDPQEDQLKAGAKPSDPGFGRLLPGSLRLTRVDAAHGSVGPALLPDLEPETYAGFYAAFARALASGREDDVPVPATEAKQVLRVLEAIVESARTASDVRLGAA